MPSKFTKGKKRLLPESLPQGWVKTESKKDPGVYYYVNLEKKETSWHLPYQPPKRARHDESAKPDKDGAAPDTKAALFFQEGWPVSQYPSAVYPGSSASQSLEGSISAVSEPIFASKYY